MVEISDSVRGKDVYIIQTGNKYVAPNHLNSKLVLSSKTVLPYSAALSSDTESFY